MELYFGNKEKEHAMSYQQLGEEGIKRKRKKKKKKKRFLCLNLPSKLAKKGNLEGKLRHRIFFFFFFFNLKKNVIFFI